MRIFIVVLFMITSNWQQPKCPSMIGWINWGTYIHTVKYHTQWG